MWTTSASAIFALSLAVQQAAATGWTDANTYSSPSNTDNICSEDQKGGFDWSGLSNGAFSSYGGLDFSGFKFSDSAGKRDVLLPRTFQNKCITGTVGTNAESSLKISGGSDHSFSITNMQVVSSIDAELEFMYSMGDGSTCKHTATCSRSGSTISNTQCGGAKSVTFKLPDNSEHSDCSISIHSVGFGCGKPSSTTPPMNTPTAPSVSSTVAALGTTSAPALSTSTAGFPYGNLSISAPPAGSLYSSGVLLTTSTVYITTEITKTQCASTITDCPVPSTIVETSTISAYTTVCPVSPGPGSPSATPTPATSSAVAVPSNPVLTTSAASTPLSVPATSDSITEVSSSPPESVSSNNAAGSTPVSVPVPSLPGSTQEVVTTEIVYQTTTICPITETLTSGTTQIVQTTQSVSTYYITSTKTVCTKCVAPPATTLAVLASSFSAAPAPAPSAPAPSAPCPDVLPKCLKTWIPYTGCADNSDADCFCKMANFTTNVIDCVSAWGADKTEIQSALSYLVGICAEYVPQNPAVITHVPTTITLCPPGPVPTSTAATPSVPAVSYPASISYAPGSSSVPAYPSVPESSSAPMVYSSSTASYSASEASSYVSISFYLTPSVAPSVSVPSSSTSSTSSVMAPGPSAPEVSPSSKTAAIPATSIPEITPSSNNAAIPATSTPGVTPSSNNPALPATSSSGVAPSSNNAAIPATSNPQITPYSSAPLPATSTPAPVPVGPVTTITLSTTIVVPCTYTNGPSGGATIPASSTFSTINTVVTVPQVQFTTAPAVSPGASPSVGLAAGSPSPNANAVPTATSPVSSMNAAGAQSTTLSYSVVAGTGGVQPTAITPFLGAGSALVAPGGVLVFAVVVGGWIAALM